MTLKTILKRFADIDCQFQALIMDMGIDDGCSLWEAISPNREDPDEMFLADKLNDLMPSLHRLHQDIEYLLMPCSDIHVLKKYPNDRYGYDIGSFNESRTFSCGSRLEALIHDEDGNPRWVSSRIEHNGTDYYLYGYGDVSLNGLTVRERRHPL